MIATILLCLAGLALILLGANYLVDGSCAIARKSGVSELVIGLTIVALGTSLPELVVSLFGALKGSSDIALGNVVGSNIINTGLILGLTALIAPIAVGSTSRKRDIPLNLGSALILVLFIYIGSDISRIEGIILTVLYAAYIWLCFKMPDNEAAESEEVVESTPVWKVLIMIIGGFAGLIWGGQLFVDNITSIARNLGISDAVIAVTIVALGTSLPELATSVIAAVKGSSQMALGNVLGSNISNIFLILGVTGTVCPLKPEGITTLDLSMLVVMALIVLVFAYASRKRRLFRPCGIALVLTWLAYTVYIVMQTVAL